MSSIPPTDSAPAARRPRGRIFLTRAAFVLAVLLTLIVAFYLVEKTRGNAGWKRYQDEARARGVKLTMAEHVPPPIPDERNFAAVPLFLDMFAKPTPGNPLALPSVSAVKPPPFDSAAKGERLDLAAWQKFFVETKLLTAPGESAPRDVLLALEKYAPQFEQLRIAGARPECRFPVAYEDGAAALLPHLQVLQGAARLYALRMAAHLALGDSAAAYEDFRAGFRLYTAMEKEPTLIAGLVRLSTLGQMENAVWGGLVQRQWGAAELEKIALDLAGVRLMDDYALSLGSERGFSNMIHEQILRQSPREVGALLAMAGTHNAAGTTVLGSLYPTGWVRMSQTRANRYMDEMLARVTQEPPRVFTDRIAPSVPQPVGEVGLVERARYILFLLLAPALTEVERSYAYGQTLLDQTRLGCALERHRLAQGAFPTTLDALVPASLASLPRDVMNGEPLIYRATPEGGYMLYSIAWNLTDDGGKSDPKANQKQQPDWVWAIPGK